jgi:hypothetical protein
VALDDDSRAVLRELVARIDLDEYVARVQRALEQMPEYQGFVDGQVELDDRGPAGIRWNLEIFLRWATDGGEPTAAELERLRTMIGARAAEGRPPEEGLAVYRRAMRAGWEAVLESADERERAVLGGAFDVLLEWLDIVSAVFEQAYAEEREAPVSRREREARLLFERLVAGERPGPSGERTAAAIGFALDAPHRPLVAALADGDAAEHLRLAELLRGQGVLAVAEGRRVVGLTGATAVAKGRRVAGLAEAGPVDIGALRSGERLVVCEVAVGEGIDGASTGGGTARLDGARETAGGAGLAAPRTARGAGLAAPRTAGGAGLAARLDEARTVVGLALAAGRRGRVDLDAYLPELLIANSPQLAARLSRRVFDPLTAAGRDDLAETLALLAANGFERAATAAALPVHRNTLLQRVARIEQLTGLDLDDPRDRGTVWLATLARRHG